MARLPAVRSVREVRTTEETSADVLRLLLAAAEVLEGDRRSEDARRIRDLARRLGL